MQEARVGFLGPEDHLEKEMATRSSILAWEISWAEEADWVQSMGLQKSEHDLETKQQTQSEDYRKHPFPDTLPLHQQGSNKKEDHSLKTSNTGLLSKEGQLGKPKVKRKNRNKDSKGI